MLIVTRSNQQLHMLLLLGMMSLAATQIFLRWGGAGSLAWGDEAVRLTTPITMSLEEAIAYINDDELVEVTPRSIRLRKLHLDPHERKRRARAMGE